MWEWHWFLLGIALTMLFGARCAEAFEICEYGRRPTKEELLKLFPFVPK